MLAAATPALAQTPQEGQYDPEDPCAGLSGVEFDACLVDTIGPGPYSCADYYNYEILGEIPEECATQEGIDTISAAGNSSNQTFEGLSDALSGDKSDDAGDSEADAAEVDESAPQPGTKKSGGPGAAASRANEPAAQDESDEARKDANDKGDSNGGGPKKTDSDKDGSNDEDKAGVKESFADITELPETGGAAAMFLGAGVLFLAGGLTVTRLFR